MNSYTLSDETALQLIENYKSCRVLWDPKDPNYVNKSRKAEAWKEIAWLSGLPEDICRRKMVSLMSSYRREKCKHRKTRRTAKELSEVYHSRWFAYEAFRFLEDRYKPRKGITSTDPMDVTNDAEDEDSRQQQQGEEQAESFVPPSAPQRVKRRQKESMRIMSDTLAVMKTAAGNLTNSDNHCVAKSFGNFLVTKMMSYSSETRNGVEHAIFDILKKADRGFFEQNANNQTAYLQQNPKTVIPFIEPRPHSAQSASVTPSTHSPQYLIENTPSSASGYDDSDDSNDYIL